MYYSTATDFGTDESRMLIMTIGELHCFQLYTRLLVLQDALFRVNVALSQVAGNCFRSQ